MRIVLDSNVDSRSSMVSVPLSAPGLLSTVEQEEQDITYKTILHDLTPILLQGRPWDYEHVLWCIPPTKEILRNETLPFSVYRTLLPAVLFHDIGWGLMMRSTPQNTPAVALHSTQNGRMAHMSLGASCARAMLPSYGFCTAEIDDITAMVAEHDNAYLGKPFEHLHTKYLQDVDLLWRLSSRSITESAVRRGESIEEALDRTLYDIARRGGFVTSTAQSLAQQCELTVRDYAQNAIK